MTTTEPDAERIERFTCGAVVELTTKQRNYIAFKLLNSLDHAKENRRRIVDKYGDKALPVGTDHTIHSLKGLGIKLGLTEEDMR